VELGAAVHALPGLTPGQRVAVARCFAQALRRVGQRERARAVLEAALASARAGGEPAHVGLLLESLAVIHSAEGDNVQAMQCTQEAIALFERTGQRIERAGALASLATQLHDIGRLDEALLHYEAALAEQREIGERFAEGVVLGNLATLYNDQGHLARARELYLQTIDICREVGDLEGEGLTQGNLGKLALDERCYEEAEQAHGRALQIARRIGHRRNQGVSLGQLGIALRELGRHAEAREHYQQALAIARETGNRRFEGQTLGNLAELELAAHGNAVAARSLCARAEALLREIDDPVDLAEVLCQRARIDLALGERDVALAALAEARALGERLGLAPSSAHGQALAELQARLAALPAR
jgi:tetratricopeptide (TPR) repeat protein